MKRLFISLLFATLLPGVAEAACYAEYKANRKVGSNLQLHYGIMLLSSGGCPGQSSAERIVEDRLRANGWNLSTVISVSTTTPSSRKEANAGQYYLRY